MQHQLVIRNSIAINSTASYVWEVLTNPAITKKYMFGCETRSEWKIDSPLIWCGNVDGAEIIFVKGNIVEIEHNRFLAYTTFDPNSSIDDIPENYLTVTYELSIENDQVILTVTQGDFAAVEDGERRFQQAQESGGWDPILAEIKKISEVAAS